MEKLSDVINSKGVDVIAPNLKRRLSGVTATIASLVALQAKSLSVVATGPGLPPNVPHLPLWRVLLLPRRLRVWHARRNNDLLLGLLLKWLKVSKLKVVFTSASPRARTRWTEFLVRRCDVIVATSQINAAVMHRPCEIIPHGVDTERFSPIPYQGEARANKVVGCFGRIRPKKGTLEFVEALCRVLPDRPIWSGVVMGRIVSRDRNYHDRIVQMIAAAGLEERIQVVAEVSVDKMPDSYRMLSLYVAPSHLEGFGLTVAEALSSGVPTIATRGVGAFDDLIEENKNGLLFQHGDVDELERCVAHLMDQDEIREKMALAARDSATQRMSLKVEAEKLVDIYRRLLAS